VRRESLDRTPSAIRRTGAKLLVTDGHRALLIRERRRNGSTFWTLPGGGVDPGESLDEGLRREIDEELQCDCAIGRPLAVCTYRHATRPDVETSYTVFGGALRSPPSPNPAEDVTDCSWFAPGTFPASLLTPFRTVLQDLVSRPGWIPPERGHRIGRE